MAFFMPPSPTDAEAKALRDLEEALDHYSMILIGEGVDFEQTGTTAERIASITQYIEEITP